jgi:hypothetical protein
VCQAGTCATGAPLSCDDGEFCTVDTCSAALGCRHERLGYAAARSAIDASFFIAACVGEKVPPAIGRQLGKARGLLERAGRAPSPRKPPRLVRRAIRRLGTALAKTERAARHGLPPACATPLGEIIADAQRRARCLVEPPT